MVATPGPVTITCPLCRASFSVPTEVMGTDGHQVIVRMDNSDVREHYATCAKSAPLQITAPAKAAVAKREPAKWPTNRELPGRIGRMLDMGAYVATGGSRACTMCGATGQDCLTRLRKDETACCASCGNGNTHPAPGELETCAGWAEVHGAKA